MDTSKKIRKPQSSLNQLSKLKETNMADEQCSESIDSLDKSCNELKHAYDACFNLWFTEKFLKKDPKDPIANPCAAMLKEYSKCVKLAMKAKNMDPDAYAKHWEGAAEEIPKKKMD